MMEVNELKKDTDVRKKIVILADLPVWELSGLDYLSRPGPQATWLVGLYPYFGEFKDYDIHWVTFTKAIKKSELHERHGQTIHVLPRRKKMISMVTGYLFETVAIHRLLKKLKPDLLHAWGSEDVYGIAGAFAGISPKLFTIQGCLTHYRNQGFKGWLFNLQALYEKPTISRFAIGTAETKMAKRLLEQLNPQMDVRQIDNGINDIFFKTSRNRSKSPTVLFVGSVTERKGIQDLISVAEDPDFREIQFRIVGDGDLCEELEQKNLSNVHWLGKLDRDGVTAEMAQAWCFACPTYSDTGPSVVKEALAMTLPVLTTENAGAACYLEESDYGKVISAGDTQALKKEIRRFCSEEFQSNSMGEDIKAKIRKQLHPAETTARFIELYDELLR